MLLLKYKKEEGYKKLGGDKKMAKGMNVKEKRANKKLDAFIENVENGGAAKELSTSKFSMEQFFALEKLKEKKLITMEFHPVYVVTVKRVKGVK